jgi:GDP-4-dehydro-6-deoxy-D-mannose reductase
METVRRNLITGITGFAGCYLARALLGRGESVIGVARRAEWPASAADLAGSVELIAGDVSDFAALDAVLRRARPTHVYHLAGFSNAGRSFKQPEEAWDGNLTATRRLFQAVGVWGENPRVLWVGSGLVYGQPLHPEVPVHEGTELRPDTPYAASKAAADLVAFMAWRAAGLDVVRARPFNHTGPDQSAEFAIPSFARQLVAIERGESPPVLQVGNLNTHRDLSDVRDVVAAYLLLMDRGRAGEAYNVASGCSTPMSEVLDRLVRLTGLHVEVRTDPSLLRPAEQVVAQVDVGKIRRETGWRPNYTLEQTLRDTLDAWRRGAGGAR